jgi:hypothetical protein
MSAVPANPSDAVSPATRRPFLRSREAIAAAVAFAGECLIVVLVFSGGATLSVAVALHGLVAAAAAALLLWRRPPDSDVTVASVMALVIAVAGPAGAAASLAIVPFAGNAGAGARVLDAWYQRLANAAGADPATETYDRVHAGRVVRFASDVPHDFAEIITSGTLAERQAALGLMARTFHTDFAPALVLALRSPEPVVRVQASAVVARVRGELKVRIASRLNAATAHLAGISAAGELQRLATCPLVDGANRARCGIAEQAILARELRTSRDVIAEAAGSKPGTAPVIERFLLTAGRYKDFRAARRIHDVASGGRYRVRRIGDREAPS